MGEIRVEEADVWEEGIAKLLHSRSTGDGRQEDIVIFKGKSDARNYRRIVLENAMRVLLVSDPETDKAAASMDVHVGYFSDPDELPGLAHFLEHMLFFSNEKYPEEGSFKKFLAVRGGSSNAYTDSLSTNFQFDVGVDHLEDSLDRFAQFFICPLFAEDATYREIRAVNSENSRNSNSDVHRFAQLEDHLTSKDHPLHKFSCGNLQTLEVVPKSKGINTRAEMLKFYENYYSSNLMCLAIYGKEDLDALQALVKDKFSAVKNLQREVLHLRRQPCSAEHLQILVKAVPITEGHSLKLTWPITPSLLHHREGPALYTAHLMGREGPGSLSSLLKELGWAESVYAGEESSLLFSFFELSIELTDAGQEHMEEIVGLIFQYLSILQRKDGVVSWIFEEMKSVAEMRFHFGDKYSPLHYTVEITQNMRKFPPEDWLSGALPRIFDQRVISETAVKLLTPERVRIFSYSKTHKGIARQTEPWYGTEFSCEKINEALINTWRSAEVDPRLHLPAPNEFIPSDFSILNDANVSKVQVPYILRSTKISRLWYKPATEFRTPKAQISMRFTGAESSLSPEVAILAAIFSDMVDDYLSAYAFTAHARIAGLNYGVWSTVDGLIVQVAGYSSKLIHLVNKILEVIINFEVRDDRFNAMKERLLKHLMNHRFKGSLDQAKYNGSFLLNYDKIYYTDMLEVLPNLTADDLRNMVLRLFSRIFLESFISGNITSVQAEDFLEHVEKCLSNGPIVKCKPVFLSQLMEQRITRMENGANFTYPAVARDPEDENSALYLHLQLGQEETELNILTELLTLMMNEEFFHQLRTVEQLGYLVYLQSRVLWGVRSIEFCILSTLKDPEGLEARVEAFLEQFGRSLENMSQEEFETNLRSFINLKLEKKKNMWEETAHFWTEIKEGTLKFKRAEVEAAAAQNLQKQAVVDFYHTYVSRHATRRKKLSSQTYGCKHLQTYMAMKKGSSGIESRDRMEGSSSPRTNLPKNIKPQVAEGETSGTREQLATLLEIRKSHSEEEVDTFPSSDKLDGEVERGVEEKLLSFDDDQEAKSKRRAQVIHDMNVFKRSQCLYSSPWGGLL